MEDQIQNSFKNAHLLRGLIINNMSLVERLVDNILARYFTANSDRYDDILGLIFCTERITFYNKVCIMREILKNKYESLYKSNYNKVLNQIVDELLPLRNKFAHNPITNAKGDDNIIIELSRAKDGLVNTITFTNKDVQKFSASVQVCSDALKEIMEKIKELNVK